ncbi:MAG TPA: transporter [Thermoanaerobaculia bacterium]|nr:transporter [Thermoanaerobaculia bacterium]
MLKPLFVPAGIALRIGATGLLLSIAAFGSPARAQEAPPPAEPAAAEAESEQEEELFDPSDTGYLDSAVIRDQVRLRYDSAFDADRPDRAEFLYGKCLCFTAVAGQDAASPGPAHDLDFQEVELAVERAFGERFSLFLEAPFRSIDLTLPLGFPEIFGITSPDIDNSGIGDLRVGAKYALVARRDRWVTLQLRGYIPTGDAGKNLGTDHASLEPAILYYGRLSDRWTFSSEARWWYPLSGSSDPVTGASNLATGVGRAEKPIRLPDGTVVGPDPAVSNDGFAGDVLRFGAGATYEGRGSRVSLSPIVELVGWYVLDGYATRPAPSGRLGFIEEADGTTIVNLKLGARIDLGRSDSVYVGFGVALTDDVWYDDVFRVEYRYTF